MARIALLVAAMLAAGSIAGCALGGSDRVGAEGPGETRVLTMVDPFGKSQEFTEFTEEVARLSNGALRIRVVPNRHDSPDFESALIRDMRNGRADLAAAGSRAWDEFGVERMRALQAPFLIDSYPLQERVLRSDLIDPMLDELRPLGLVGVGILPGGIRRPLGAAHRLASTSDFRGLTIATQQSRVADATLRALGAHPRRFPPSIPSLDGIDGVEQRVAGIEVDRLDVDGSHLMRNVNLWPRPLVVFANADSFARLTSDQRRILQAAAANTVPSQLAEERNLEVESAGNLCRHERATFDSATSAELRALRRAVEPVYADLERDPGTRTAIKAIERLKRQLAEQPAEVPACKGGTKSPGSTDGTAIDGVWRMDTDPSAAAPDGEAENWGRWIFVFDRGRFAITQENQQACTWGYGTFTVDKNRTSWTFTDGGGIAPNNAQNKPGEYFVFDFSAYRDTLSVKPVKGQISPLGFRAEPWRRLSDTPSRQYFSKRCPPPAAALPD